MADIKEAQNTATPDQADLDWDVSSETPVSDVETDDNAPLPTNLAADMGVAEADTEEAVDDTYFVIDDEGTDAVAPQVSVRVDEIFQHITAFRALVDNGIPEESLLGRSLRAQTNAVFNQAFFNLQARYGFAEAFVDAPLGEVNDGKPTMDITDVAISEVLRLQRIIK